MWCLVKISLIWQNFGQIHYQNLNFFSKMTQIHFWDRFWTALDKLLWETMISFLKKWFYDPLLGHSNFFFGPPKKRNISGGPRPPVNPAAYFRDPKKRPRGINIDWKCSNVHPMCPQYARNNFCQPYPALENTTTSSKSRKTRKSRCFTVT